MARLRGTVPGRAAVTPPFESTPEATETSSADLRAGEKLLLLMRVGRIIASDLKLFDMLQKTADAIHELLGYPNVDLPLLDERDSEMLVVRIRGGSYKARMQHEDRIPIARGVMGAAVRERRTQVVNDIASDPRYVQPPSGIAVRAELAVPILHAGKALGVVNVEGDQPFTAVDVQVLEMVADSLAVAIENTRLFAQERRLAILEERQRLARDLHDSVSQLLFSSTLLAESLPALMRKGIAEAEAKLERLIELNRRALGEMRGLLRELAPGGTGADFSSRELPPPAMVMLHRHGLVEALRTELATVEAQGLAVHLEASTYERQSREREEMLLRVAQEALANAVKHAQAREVRLRLVALEGEVLLAVQDDGCGFDARLAVRDETVRARSEGGMGLRSMRDRIRALFGQLTVESAPGFGTTVEARLPR
ncbi:MAG: GAF domain-containing sensor histidine kinase [Thermoanaerobaculia bacterium]